MSLYPLIQGKGHLTLVNTNPVDLILYPPPENWIWQHPKEVYRDGSTRIKTDLEHMSKCSVSVKGASVLRVTFGPNESGDIWRAASNYVPPSSQRCPMFT